jgi:RDD family protein
VTAMEGHGRFVLRRGVAFLLDAMVSLPPTLLIERVIRYLLFLSLYAPEIAIGGKAYAIPYRFMTTAPDVAFVAPILWVSVLVYRAIAERNGAGLGKMMAGVEVVRSDAEVGLARSLIRASLFIDVLLLAFLQTRPVDRALGTRVARIERLTLLERIGARLPAAVAAYAISLSSLACFLLISQAFTSVTTEVLERAVWSRLKAANAEFDCCTLGVLSGARRENCSESIRWAARSTDRSFKLYSMMPGCDRLAALFVFGTPDVGGTLASALERGAASNDGEIKRRSLEVLANEGALRSRALEDAVVEALESEDSNIVAQAGRILVKWHLEPEAYGELMSRAAPKIAAHHFDEAPWNLTELAELAGPDAAPLTPLLAAGLDADSYYFMPKTLRALGQIGVGARASIPAIERMIERATRSMSPRPWEAESQANAASWGIWALGRMGGDALSALERLEKSSHRAGLNQDAIAWARVSIAAETDGIGASFGRAQSAAVLAARGETELAQEKAEAILEGHPADGPSLFVLATIALEAKDYLAARLRVRRLAEVRPNARAVVRFLDALIDRRASKPAEPWLGSARFAWVRSERADLHLPEPPSSIEPVDPGRFGGSRTLDDGERFILELTSARSLRDRLEICRNRAEHSSTALIGPICAAQAAALLHSYEARYLPQASLDRAATLIRDLLDSLRRKDRDDLVLEAWAFPQDMIGQPMNADELIRLEAIADRAKFVGRRPSIYRLVRDAWMKIDPRQAHERAAEELESLDLGIPSTLVARIFLTAGSMARAPERERALFVRATQAFAKRLVSAPSIRLRITGRAISSARSSSTAVEPIVESQMLRQAAMFSALPLPSLVHELDDRLGEDEAGLFQLLSQSGGDAR